jgi:hypothetical protein
LSGYRTFQIECDLEAQIDLLSMTLPSLDSIDIRSPIQKFNNVRACPARMTQTRRQARTTFPACMVRQKSCSDKGRVLNGCVNWTCSDWTRSARTMIPK